MESYKSATHGFPITGFRSPQDNVELPFRHPLVTPWILEGLGHPLSNNHGSGQVKRPLLKGKLSSKALLSASLIVGGRIASMLLGGYALNE